MDAKILARVRGEREQEGTGSWHPYKVSFTGEGELYYYSLQSGQGEKVKAHYTELTNFFRIHYSMGHMNIPPLFPTLTLPHPQAAVLKLAGNPRLRSILSR